jgi:hypothetical protein
LGTVFRIRLIKGQKIEQTTDISTSKRNKEQIKDSNGIERIVKIKGREKKKKEETKNESQNENKRQLMTRAGNEERCSKERKLGR